MNRLEDLRSAIQSASSAYHRLILLVAPAGSARSWIPRHVTQDEGWPILNLSLELARGLNELPVRARSRKVTEVAEAAVVGTGAAVVALDHIELVFDPSLQQDPLRLLQQLSRTRTILAAWPGTYEQERLSYAEPGHPEYRCYTKPDAQVLVLRATSQGPTLGES